MQIGSNEYLLMKKSVPYISGVMMHRDLGKVLQLLLLISVISDQLKLSIDLN
jgi:hypothetical protein